VTGIVTVVAPALPWLSWILMFCGGIGLLGGPAKPESGSSELVSVTSPGFAATVTTAPVYVPGGTETVASSWLMWSSCSRLIAGAEGGAV